MSLFATVVEGLVIFSKILEALGIFSGISAWCIDCRLCRNIYAESNDSMNFYSSPPCITRPLTTQQHISGLMGVSYASWDFRYTCTLRATVVMPHGSKGTLFASTDSSGAMIDNIEWIFLIDTSEELCFNWCPLRVRLYRWLFHFYDPKPGWLYTYCTSPLLALLTSNYSVNILVMHAAPEQCMDLVDVKVDSPSSHE